MPLLALGILGAALLGVAWYCVWQSLYDDDMRHYWQRRDEDRR